MTHLTIDMLAGALKVSRRTIERCIESGTLVPVPGVVAVSKKAVRVHHKRRYTFGPERVAELKDRADAARKLGLKNIMRAVLADGPVTRAARFMPTPRLSAHDFIARVLWKRQNLPRHKAPAVPSEGQPRRSALQSE